MHKSLELQPKRSIQIMLLAGAVSLVSALATSAVSSELARAALAVLPLPFYAAHVWSVCRSVRESDELARLVHFKAIGIAFPLTALAALTYSFLETAGLPHLSMAYVWSFMLLSWSAAFVIVSSRYES